MSLTQADVKKTFVKIGSNTSTSDTVLTKELLGGKGYSLHKWALHGFPVPSGVIIPTTICRNYLNSSPTSTTQSTIYKAIFRYFDKYMEEGLLYSVRSGAPVSMPGMMDTIPNVGINSINYPNFVKKYGEEFVNSVYRLFLSSYAKVCLNLEVSEEDTLEDLKNKCLTLNPDILTSPPAQLATDAAIAVFNSWNNPRAVEYRAEHSIPNTLNTACILQRMVFGNLDSRSCTGVLFTRNPITGEDKLFGEWMKQAQGEQLVSGEKSDNQILPIETLLFWDQEVYNKLHNLSKEIERLELDMQDIEFTVEAGELYLLQSRSGKRQPEASFRIAKDMLEGSASLTKSKLQSMIPVKHYLHYCDSYKYADVCGVEPHSKGLPACAGTVTGVVANSTEKAIEISENGGHPILVRPETVPEDFLGMRESVGVLTRNGGITSHAAVVARSINTPCVVSWDGPDLEDGTPITIDGASGSVWLRGFDVITSEVPKTEEVKWFEDKVREYDSTIEYDLVKDSSVVISLNNMSRDELFKKLVRYRKAKVKILADCYSSFPIDSYGADFLNNIGKPTPCKYDPIVFEYFSKPQWRQLFKSYLTFVGLPQDNVPKGYKNVEMVTSLAELLDKVEHYSVSTVPYDKLEDVEVETFARVREKLGLPDRFRCSTTKDKVLTFLTS